MRESTISHPGLAQLRRTHRVWTPSMLRLSERWMSLWQQSGLPLDKAVLAAKISSTAIIGFVDELSILRNMDLPSDELLKWLPNARMLLQPKVSNEAQFELVARSLIEGLYTRLAREQPVPARAAKQTKAKRKRAS
jgi:hypothetical protein